MAERDAIANARDRGAVERDSIANARDRAAVERDAAGLGRGRADDRHDPFEQDDEALERARLEAELQRAHLDGLTGAFRREMGRLALRNEIDRARRADGKFVIAYIDVDGLKGVNDRNGHAAGDRVLRMLVATMRANLRSYDPIVRFGGDEFVCGIASIDPGEVQHRIGVIDQSMRQATGVGITAGLAELTPSESLDDLTARADAALIEANAQPRRVAGDPPGYAAPSASPSALGRADARIDLRADPARRRGRTPHDGVVSEPDPGGRPNAPLAGQELRGVRRHPDDAQGPVRDRRPRRRHRRPLLLRARMALVDGHGPVVRRHVVPHPPPRVLDVRPPPRGHGRRAAARRRARRVFDIPPGHDKWVVGDEPWIAIEWGASSRAARAVMDDGGARSLATLLFTDIVDSTASLQRLGDAAWHDLLAAHNARLREQLNVFRGREVKTTGDGVLAVFDSPARAVGCAVAMTRSTRQIGVEIRVGVHTGEIEAVGDDVRGIAVHTAARVTALAGAGEVLVSATTAGLLEGSSVRLEDAGTHELKGIDGPRQLFRVVDATPG